MGVGRPGDRSDGTGDLGDPAGPLERFGWDAEVERSFAHLDPPHRLAGRVVSVHRINCDVVTDRGLEVALPGAEAMARLGAPLPAVGDWVALEQPDDGGETVVIDVVPRRSAISRRDPADRVSEQVLAANIDEVLVVHGLDQELNLRRIERSLVLAWDSGAEPVIVLTKSDLLDEQDVGAAIAAVATVALDAPVVATSATTGAGIDALLDIARPNRTLALIGASGAGKSTLVNRLVGEDVQEVADVRDGDAKGRHTTTRRELVPLPGGGVLVDTPGLRGLGLWDAEQGISRAFADIEDLATACRFADCSHEHEPGCAVKDAVADGRLPARRVESYLHLHEELARLRDQQEEQRRAAGRGGRRR